MILRDHILTSDVDGFQVEHRMRSHKDVLRRDIIIPRLILIHYAVTHTYDDTARLGQAMQGAAWHFSAMGTQIAQHLPTNRRGSHAGVSEWKGVKSVNDYSIGIEIANPGPLRRGADGQYRDTTKWAKIWRGEVVELNAKGFRYWAAISDETIDTVKALSSVLVAGCDTLIDLAGHSQVAPGRKIDPGPAFPIEAVRVAVFPNLKAVTL